METAHFAELTMRSHAEASALTGQISMEEKSRQRLEKTYTQIRGMGDADFMSWLVGLKQKLGQQLEAVSEDRPAVLQRFLYAMRTVVIRGAVGVLEFLISNYQAIDTKHQQRRVAIDSLCEDIKTASCGCKASISR
jgi:hypothetical protein